MNCILCSKPLTRRWPWLWAGGRPAHLTCVMRLPPSWDIVGELVRKMYAARVRASLFLRAPLFSRLRSHRRRRFRGRSIVVPITHTKAS